MRFFGISSAGALLWLLLCLPSLAAEDAVHMLREMFEKPVDGWKQHLKSHAGLLDAGFFESVGKRIRWGIENNHVDDAFRFALVADLAAQVVGKPDNYRIDLAEVFLQKQNGFPGPDIYFSDPDQPGFSSSYWPKEYQEFVDAQIREAQKDLIGAYTAYVDLAKRGYLPSQTWYRAALISRYLGRHRLAAEEFALAERNGAPDPIFGPLEVPGWISPTPILPDSPHPGGWPAADLDPYSESQGHFDTMFPVRPSSAQKVTPFEERDLSEDLRHLAASFQLSDVDGAKEYGGLLYRLGDLGRAREVYDQALLFHPLDPELLRGRANTLERLFDQGGSRSLLQAAVADYRKAAALAPSHDLLPGSSSAPRGNLNDE